MAWTWKDKEIVRKMAKEHKTLAEVITYFSGIKSMKVMLLQGAIHN